MNNSTARLRKLRTEKGVTDGAVEHLAEQLHADYRAAFKALHTKDINLCTVGGEHDHGWTKCHRKDYFRQRAAHQIVIEREEAEDALEARFDRAVNLEGMSAEERILSIRIDDRIAALEETLLDPKTWDIKKPGIREEIERLKNSKENDPWTFSRR